MKILILASNPRKDLNLEEEIRHLQGVIERSKNRENLEVEVGFAVRPEDLQGLLLKHEPDIVHFCGHGTGQQGLVLQEDIGLEKLVSTDALSNLFELCSQWVKCVLLNACYSEVQANAIVRHIDYAIGMNHEIRDNAAIAFATGFYQALGYGQPIEKSYKFGCNAIQLQISDSSNFRSVLSEERRKLEVATTVERVVIPEYLKPVLKIKPNLTTSVSNSTSDASENVLPSTKQDIQLSIDKALEQEIAFGQERKQSPKKPLSQGKMPISSDSKSMQPRKKSTRSLNSIKNLFTTISNFKTILLKSGVILIFGLLALPVYRNVILVDPRYTYLEELLEENEWTAADRETAVIMWEIAGKSTEQSLSPEDFANFPCKDLQKIDNLWLQYSDNLFGFSVQTRIWKDVDGRLEDFVHRVGWGEKEEDGFFYYGIENPNFNLSEPPGMLPWLVTYQGGDNDKRESYIARLTKCDIDQSNSF
ncbi:MAG: GUN4 domain-containing protein [Waterburya sp.]